jgi:hypothetical protein
MQAFAWNPRLLQKSAKSMSHDNRHHVARDVCVALDAVCGPVLAATACGLLYRQSFHFLSAAQSFWRACMLPQQLKAATRSLSASISLIVSWSFGPGCLLLLEQRKWAFSLLLHSFENQKTKYGRII